MNVLTVQTRSVEIALHLKLAELLAVRIDEGVHIHFITVSAAWIELLMMRDFSLMRGDSA